MARVEMGERASTRIFNRPSVVQGGRLRDLCATTAEARRQIAVQAPDGLGDLQARLGALIAALAEARIDAGDRAALLALLDEVGGLVGQLELEREAARTRILALDRHRQAELSYGRARRRE